MKRFKLKLVPTIAARAMTGLAGAANAKAYADSYDNTSSLTMSNPVKTMQPPTKMARAPA